MDKANGGEGMEPWIELQKGIEEGLENKSKGERNDFIIATAKISTWFIWYP